MSHIRSLCAGIVLAILAVALTAAPASAHDQLASSSPKPGEALAGAPSSVELVFTGDVLTIGAVVVVADASGSDWVAGEPAIDGSTVTVGIREGLPEAGYEVRWRAVSGDGHAISGIIPFTVGDAEPLVRAAADQAAAPGDADSDAASPSPQQNDGLRVVLIGVGGAVIATAVLLVIRFISRRRALAVGAGPSDDVPDEN